MIRSVLIAIVILAGCTTEKSVLIEGRGSPITSCAGVWTRGHPGAACDFAGSCEQPSNDGCCTGLAACRAGVLAVETTCDPRCTAGRCESDRDCTRGVTLCDTGSCQECPAREACPPCAAPLERRVRNGCETCVCTPPSECDRPLAPCDRGVCYAGAMCVPGCSLDDATCCANVCAAESCPQPAPLGCAAQRCDPSCSTCITTACECVGGAWRCTAECAPSARTTCTYD